MMCFGAEGTQYIVLLPENRTGVSAVIKKVECEGRNFAKFN